MRPRSDGAMRGQGRSSKARAGGRHGEIDVGLVALGTWRSTSPVAGSSTAKVLPDFAGTRLPSININGLRPRKPVECRSLGSSAIVSMNVPPVWLTRPLGKGRLPGQYRCIQTHMA